jgi:hypothetical protein
MVGEEVGMILSAARAVWEFISGNAVYLGIICALVAALAVLGWRYEAQSARVAELESANALNMLTISVLEAERALSDTVTINYQDREYAIREDRAQSARRIDAASGKPEVADWRRAVMPADVISVLRPDGADKGNPFDASGGAYEAGADAGVRGQH